MAENVTAGTNLGSPVEATDADDDTLTYTLSGVDAESFDIDASAGQLQTKATLDAETKSSYTVEVTASDSSDSTLTITVIITVTDVDYDCVSGNAVADADNNPGLVSDCEALLEARDKLAGTGSLNWSEDLPIAEWDGITL